MEGSEKWLSENAKFRSSDKNPVKIFSPENIEVDLIPYGPIEQEGEVDLGNLDDKKLVVQLKEILENLTHNSENQIWQSILAGFIKRIQ